MFKFKYKICHFCELPIGNYEDKNVMKDNLFNYNDLWICDGGESLQLSNFYIRKCNKIRLKKDTIRENEECLLCYESKTCMELPDCTHRLCLDCIKTIYFGNSEQKRPLHWGELSWPKWPEELHDKYFDEYLKHNIKNKFIKYKNKITLDELKYQRDLDKLHRPSWMNDPVFIEYEDNQFIYELNTKKIHDIYRQYEDSKIRGNKKCPYCRL